MKNGMARLGLYLAGATALLVAGCGGGGGSAGGTPLGGATPVYTSISGVVGYGAGAAGARVELRDLEGQLDSTLTNASAGFQFSLANVTRALKPPFVIKAEFKTGSGAPVTLFSISQAAQGGAVRMNVTPITDMITRAHIAPDGGDPSMVRLEDTIPNNPNRLANIVARTKEMFGSMLPNKITDFVSEDYVPNPTRDDYDRILEQVKVVVDSTGVKLKTTLGKLLAQRTSAQLRSDQARTDDDSSITDAEAAQAEADRGPLPVGEQIAANLLPVALENEVVVDVNGSYNLVLQGRNATSFAITRQPAHGTLSVVNASLGLYIYTPVPGWTGTDEFLFTVSNEHGTSTAVRVRLLVSDGCTSHASGTTLVTYTTSCDKPQASAPVIITPAAGYPFSTAPESLLATNDPPVLRLYSERSVQTTNIKGVSGIDLHRRTAAYDATADRYVVTSSGGFYSRTTGARLPQYADQDFVRTRATYARHPSGTGYVLTGYAYAKMSLEPPHPSYEPYEFGVMTQYVLKGYDMNNRPLYEGRQILCIAQYIVSLPTATLFEETVSTWSPSGTTVGPTARTMNCSINMDLASSIAYETKPADLRHNWN